MGMSRLRFLPMRLAFVAPAEGGGEGGGGTGGGAGAAGGTGGAGGAGASGGGQDDGKGGASGWTPPATQADLDRIVGERLARERAKFADYDTLRQKASKLDEIEQANASDLDKAVKKAREDALSEATAATQQVLVQAEARALAAAARFRNPGDAIALLAAEKKLDGVTVTGHVVDQAAVKAAIDQLAKDRPYLLDTGTNPPGFVPGAGQRDSGTAKPKNLTEAVNAHYKR